MFGPATAQGMATRLDAVADVYAGNLLPAATAAGMAAKREATFVANDVAGGRLSHMGKRGTRLTSGFDVGAAGKTVTIALRPPGPWMILERGAKGHVIGPRRTRTTKAGHARTGPRTTWAVQGAGYAHPVRSAQHPGTGGKRAVSRAFGRMRTAASKAFHDEQVQQLRRIYGGG